MHGAVFGAQRAVGRLGRGGGGDQFRQIRVQRLRILQLRLDLLQVPDGGAVRDIALCGQILVAQLHVFDLRLQFFLGHGRGQGALLLLEIPQGEQRGDAARELVRQGPDLLVLFGDLLIQRGQLRLIVAAGLLPFDLAFHQLEAFGGKLLHGGQIRVVLVHKVPITDGCQPAGQILHALRAGQMRLDGGQEVRLVLPHVLHGRFDILVGEGALGLEEPLREARVPHAFVLKVVQGREADELVPDGVLIRVAERRIVLRDLDAAEEILRLRDGFFNIAVGVALRAVRQSGRGNGGREKLAAEALHSDRIHVQAAQRRADAGVFINITDVFQLLRAADVVLRVPPVNDALQGEDLAGQAGKFVDLPLGQAALLRKPDRRQLRGRVPVELVGGRIGQLL